MANEIVLLICMCKVNLCSYKCRQSVMVFGANNLHQGGHREMSHYRTGLPTIRLVALQKLQLLLVNGSSTLTASTIQLHIQTKYKI